MERTAVAEVAAGFERLVVVMRALAAGDDAAVFVLHKEFNGQLRGAVLRQLARFRVRSERELVDDLVIEAAFIIQDVAAGWDPNGGALPWVWAERRIGARVAAWLGQHTVDVDVDGLDREGQPLATAVADPEETVTLEALAALNPQIALLEEALLAATSVRDRLILLAYEARRADGDPSPAKTLSDQFQLSPANVRQIVKRAKDKVRRLVTTDDRFASLRDLHLLR